MHSNKNIMKNKTGITLIALVITIIVLLILAGVSIAMLTGNNGILTQANQAKENSNREEAKEKVQVEALGSIDKSGKFNSGTFENNLKKNLKLSDNDIVENEDTKTITVTVDGYNVIIDAETGKIKKISKLDSTNQDTIKDIEILNQVETGNIEDKEINLTWTELKQVADKISINTNIKLDTTAVTVIVGEQTETLRIGNYKILKYNGINKKVRIIGFNTDTKVNGDKAGITFDFVTTLENMQINDTDTNIDGWGNSKIKKETI